MIEILESPKHLVAMKISDSITAEDIDQAYKVTDEALKANELVSFFAEIDDSMGFTVEGLLKDLWKGLGQLGRLGKYYRAAVVTDKGWIATMARVEGLVFSSIDVRVFEPAERSKALAWASEAPEPLPKPEDAPASIQKPKPVTIVLKPKTREKKNKWLTWMILLLVVLLLVFVAAYFLDIELFDIELFD